MCTPSELVVLRFKLKESYENILDNGTRKEPSATKPQLFEAIWSLFRDLDAATPDGGRPPGEPPHLDAEDIDDQSQSQSESQSRLQSQSQSQSMLPYSTYSQSQSQFQPHAQASRTPTQLAVEGERLARMELAKATRIAQELTQADAQEAIRVKQDATANSKKAKKGERYQATMEKLGKPPPCPILCRGEECSGSPCAEEEETGLSYSHMDDMVVCQDKTHVSMTTSSTCLIFHNWPPRKRSPKPKPPAKNGGGGTSGARQPPRNNNGNPRAGKPRQSAKGTQPWQQQSDITHRRAMERLNLQLEVARANAGTRSVSYANVVKGMPPFSTPPPQLHHPPSPQPPAQQPLPTGKDDDELATLLKGIMSFLSKRKM
jgi:hypothetical protein